MSLIITPTQLELDMFGGPSKWAKSPLCTNDFDEGVFRRHLPKALRYDYLNPNPPNLTIWLKQDLDFAGGAHAHVDANIIPPYYSTINRLNGHCHSSWGLSVPVLTGSPDARQAPLRFACAIQSRMCEMLGADRSYGNGLTKNPFSPRWLLAMGYQKFHTLDELAEYLPGLEKHIPKRGNPDHYGLGRNVALFDTLRVWSYRAVKKHWGGGLNAWNEWISTANARALVYNSDFPTPLGVKEVWHVSRSVAKWTWQHFTPADFSEIQRARRAKRIDITPAWQTDMSKIHDN